MNKNILQIENREKYIKLFEKYNSFLTQVQKQAFQLYFYENLSYQEIANETATTRSAAYDSVKKAIKKLIKIDEKILTN
ncbi:sigma factor-like helix-turn-helix DNA-binding protein [Mycoplasmopsis lipofaciens]|uniref:sigma factor-like helix-turn-helix DNA-binding protein n=1 Tax=Mycoplasmopsis lipofaciens TaxID=114884 RepID=UPI000480D0A7|nr:sigma factor-like helix-turn-helix DNA-binding protein [Mycoplasmopsis lipofaciens]